jgi:hypothetical protein
MFFTYNKIDGIQLNMENSSISKAFSIRRFVLKMSLMKILTLNNVIYVVDIRTNLVFSSLLNTYSFKQSFKTRTGSAGRPGTRPTRAWDRSGWRQKLVWELARWNPVNPAGRPGTRSTRSNPGETRSIFFYILTDIKRRRMLKKNEAKLGQMKT